MILAAFDILSHAPLLSIGVCLLGVAGIISARKAPNVREGVSLTTAIVNFILVVWMYTEHKALKAINAAAEVAHKARGAVDENGELIKFVPEAIECTLVDITDGLRIAFRVDDLGILFALVASSLWILNTLYSIGYMRAHKEHKQTRFYACFAIAISACMGAAFADNMFALFAFYELLSLCTYPLVIHAETEVAKAGAKRYLTYLLGTSIGFQLPALFLLWHLSGGTLDFTVGGLLADSTAEPWKIGLTFLLFVAGIAKCGMMPFHSWLPAAMVAPTPVSALLHAVAVVKMGVFSICRVVFDVFGTNLLDEIGVNQVVVWAACFTIVTASLVALVQDNLKRRLAYSTISQLSYIILGVTMLTHDAAIGGVSHIGFHAVSKITLFFGAGAIYVALHKTKVSELDGVGRRMPITMTAFAVGSFSMIGLPPACGLISKWYLVEGAVDGGYVAVLCVLFASALLNAAYFLPILWRAFFRPVPEGQDAGFQEAPWPCVVALSATALGALLLFFFPDLVVGLAEGVAAGMGGAP